MFSSIGFIGTGTMGTAVARAAVKGAQGAPVLLANRTRSKAEAVARELGVQTADNETVARDCGLILSLIHIYQRRRFCSTCRTSGTRRPRSPVRRLPAGPAC